MPDIKHSTAVQHMQQQEMQRPTFADTSACDFESFEQMPSNHTYVCRRGLQQILKHSMAVRNICTKRCRDPQVCWHM